MQPKRPSQGSSETPRRPPGPGHTAIRMEAPWGTNPLSCSLRIPNPLHSTCHVDQILPAKGLRKGSLEVSVPGHSDPADAKLSKDESHTQGWKFLFRKPGLAWSPLYFGPLGLSQGPQVTRTPGCCLWLSVSLPPTHTILIIRGNSPQGLELYRRRVLVTVSPPEIWVPNLEGENGLS